MNQKLQNSFNVFLPQKYFDFKSSMQDLTSNEAVVAELIRICAEEENVKAIQLAFERILGKPEKVVVIKRTLVRTVFPDAEEKEAKPELARRSYDKTEAITVFADKIVVDEANAPGLLLKRMMDKIGEENRSYAWDVLDHKENYTVAEVIVANLYAIAMRGANLAAISMLFDYIDGSVADVIRLEGEDTILLENYASVAPFDAVQDKNGVWYLETEAVS